MNLKAMKWLIPFTTAVLLGACGDPAITAPSFDHQTQIAIQGFLLPGQEVRILITRTFPLDPDTTINKFSLLIETADVVLTDLTSAAHYPLTYIPETLQYQYRGDDLVIAPGRTYHLEVTAVVNGDSLRATSTTTVPRAGFAIIDSASHLEPLRYRQLAPDGELEHFSISFRRSPGIDFYILSTLSLDASTSTYNYDNPFVDNNAADVNFFFRELIAAFEWGQSLPLDPLQQPIISVQTILWRGLLFFGRYQTIVYAADENLKDFFLTHSTVQELDGNFHAPTFHIEGDGVGIFGSAIADTVFFEILAPDP